MHATALERAGICWLHEGDMVTSFSTTTGEAAANRPRQSNWPASLGAQTVVPWGHFRGLRNTPPRKRAISCVARSCRSTFYGTKFRCLYLCTDAEAGARVL